jgi:hypothetical protein
MQVIIVFAVPVAPIRAIFQKKLQGNNPVTVVGG